MRCVLLIAVLSACSPAQRAASPTNAAQPPTQPTETLWDQGTYVTVERDLVLPDIEENFEIYRRSDGYRFVVKWKRPAPTGELSDGQVTFVTDARFSPLQGKMVTYSKIQREADGRLTTEVIAHDGKKETAGSKQPNAWYIGGSITAFLVALCQADASITEPLVYPDKLTNLAAPKPLTVEGTPRTVTSRSLIYKASGREVIAACEGGKLAGEVSRGTTIVRKDDLVLARALAAAFH